MALSHSDMGSFCINVCHASFRLACESDGKTHSVHVIFAIHMRIESTSTEVLLLLQLFHISQLCFPVSPECGKDQLIITAAPY